MNQLCSTSHDQYNVLRSETEVRQDFKKHTHMRKNEKT